MNVGSLFSGIGGLDEGLRRAGHRHVFFCESDAYRRDVLRTQFPGVPVYEDVRTVAIGEPAGRATTDGAGASVDLRRWEAGAGLPSSPNSDAELLDERKWATLSGDEYVDLLCGGFPCQDLSVAGRRAGLDGDRSGLFFEFARIIDALRPGWVLVENVPGLLSSNGGRDFAVVLGTLADIGYGVAWRIFDSRFFGVPQRRRRVFILGTVADGDPRAAAERAGEVLAVGQGCDRHLASRGKAGPISPVASLSGLGTGGPDDNDAQGARLVVETMREHPRPGSNSNGQIVAATPTKGSATGEGINQPGRRQEDDVNIVVTPAGVAESHSRAADHGDAGVVSGPPQVVSPIAGPRGGGNDGIGRRSEDDPNLVSATITAAYGTKWNDNAGASSGGNFAPPSEFGVRRLTPTECERLQGFPDNWTQLGETSDSRRYSALGDAVTVNVSEWIGRRLMARSANKATV